MALPQNYKKNLDIQSVDDNRGRERRQELKRLITNNDTNLPRGVEHRDLDKGFKDFVKERLYTVAYGEKIPVIMTGLDRWNLFVKTYDVQDSYGNIKIPFININRNPDTQFGSNPALIYNVPQGRSYYYGEVPIYNQERKGVDIYKIPQPIPVDINYTVRIFTYKQEVLNKFNKTVLQQFQSRQAYTLVNGHYIPIILNEIGDDSIFDLESKRFYVQTYTFNLQGFLIDPNKFKVVPAIDRALTSIEIEHKKNRRSADTRIKKSEKTERQVITLDDFLQSSSQNQINRSLKKVRGQTENNFVQTFNLSIKLDADNNYAAFTAPQNGRLISVSGLSSYEIKNLSQSYSLSFKNEFFEGEVLQIESLEQIENETNLNLEFERYE